MKNYDADAEHWISVISTRATCRRNERTSLRLAIEAAIYGGMPFKLNRFSPISNEVTANAEHYYSIACKHNTSAALYIEKLLDRDPFMWYRERMYVGYSFRHAGVWYQVSSFGPTREYVGEWQWVNLRDLTYRPHEEHSTGSRAFEFEETGKAKPAGKVLKKLTYSDLNGIRSAMNRYAAVLRRLKKAVGFERHRLIDLRNYYRRIMDGDYIPNPPNESVVKHGKPERLLFKL